MSPAGKPEEAGRQQEALGGGVRVRGGHRGPGGGGVLPALQEPGGGGWVGHLGRMAGGGGGGGKQGCQCRGQKVIHHPGILKVALATVAVVGQK